MLIDPSITCPAAHVLDSMRSATIACQAPSSPWYHMPVGIFAVAAGASAAAMAIKENARWMWKGAWLLMVFVLTAAELRMIVWSDADAKKERGYSECQLEQNFQTIERENQEAFSETICGVGRVFQKTEQAADKATVAVNNITGGQSFAYLLPQPVDGAEGYSVNVFNDGKNVLTGVTVRVGRVKGEREHEEEYWIDSSAMHAIPMYTIGPHSHALVPNYWIYPVENGVLATHFFAIVSAQNGDVLQDIFFRPAKKGKAYAFRFTVKRAKNMPGKYPKYTTLKTSGWIEPKPL